MNRLSKFGSGALLLALAGCSGLGAPPAVAEAKFSTQGAVLAIQLSGTARDYSADSDRGYMVLVDPEGKFSAMQIGIMDGAQPLWTKDGLFFGGADDEFFVTDEGVRRLPRENTEHHELARYPGPGGDGFISFYNVGGNGNGYLQRLTFGNADGVEDIDVPGAYMKFGQCGEKIFAITTTFLSPNLAEAASGMYEEQNGPVSGLWPAGDGAEKIYDVLVQAYPQIESPGPAVLAVGVEDTSIIAGTREMPCVGSTVYLPAFLHDHPDAVKGDGKDTKAGKPVLSAWDLDTGTRSMIVLHDDQDQPIDINTDEHGLQTGYLEGSIYHFVTRTGKVFSTELTTGLTQHEFTISPQPGGGRYHQFVVTKDYVYALNEGEHHKSSLDFSRYEMSTGAREPLFTIENMGPYREGNVYIQGVTINPNWDEFE